MYFLKIIMFLLSSSSRLSRSIEFRFYLNLNFFLKVKATYGIARVTNFDCHLTARKRLASTENLTTILEPRTFQSRTEQTNFAKYFET